jgi:hypothetical protein
MGTSVGDGTLLQRERQIFGQRSIGHCESKLHKLWFDKDRSESVDGRKQAKLQWLQDPSEVNEDDLSNVRREASKHFRSNKRKYLKENQ